MPQKSKTIRSIGRLDKFFSGIGMLTGLPGVRLHETLVDESGSPCAIVIGFDEKHVEAMFFDDDFDSSQPVYSTGESFSVKVDETVTGRVINGLGKPRDGLSAMQGESHPVFTASPMVIERDPVERPLITGLKTIDANLPLGRGQRELVVGDRSVGKSTIAETMVLEQQDVATPVHCVYVMCGVKAKRLAEAVKLFESRGAMLYTTVVAATANDSYASQYLAPFVGCAIAEYFRNQGQDALVIYDDLTKHGKVYRDVSLLLGRAPGRETYPADIFSLHAGLLERAGQMSKDLGGGSVTAIPIVQTLEGDLTSYIPTNLISITDGQIYLEQSLKDRGFQPAVNVGLSVSRLGSRVQPGPLQEVSGGLRLALAQQRQLQKLLTLETTVSEESKKRIHHGDLLLELLKQDKHETVAWPEQVALFYAVDGGFFDDLSEGQWRRFESMMLDLLRSHYGELLESIKGGDFGEEIKKQIRDAVGEFKEDFLNQLSV